jgi:pimeloyl-ACP methyl ester carboxylesterase
MVQLAHEVLKLSDGSQIGFVRVPGKLPELLAVGGYGKSALEKPLGSCVLKFALARGQACTVLEFRGQGRSSTAIEGMTVPGMRADLMSAAQALGLRDCLGVGASLGAWAMLAAQQEQNRLLSKMIGLAPAIDWDLTFFKPLSESGGLIANGSGFVQARESGIRVSQAFFDGLDACRIRPTELALAGKFIIIHGDADPIAPMSRSQRLAAEAGGRLTVVPGGGHEVSALQSSGSQDVFAKTCGAMLAGAGNKDVGA